MDNTDNQIYDTDVMYRRVPVHEKTENLDPRRRRYKYNYSTKRLEVTSCAFLDSENEVSVDLARKVDSEPLNSKRKKMTVLYL